jgi:hypothetical protein
MLRHSTSVTLGNVVLLVRGRFKYNVLLFLMCRSGGHAVARSNSEGGAALATAASSAAAASADDALRSELSNAHRRNADQAQKLLDAQHLVKQLQHRCSLNDDELDEWRDRLAKSQSRIEFLDDQCHEKVCFSINSSCSLLAWHVQNTTVQVLRDELQALQIELIKAEEKAKVVFNYHHPHHHYDDDSYSNIIYTTVSIIIHSTTQRQILAQENQALVEKYLERVNADADKMNQGLLVSPLFFFKSHTLAALNLLYQ